MRKLPLFQLLICATLLAPIEGRASEPALKILADSNATSVKLDGAILWTYHHAAAEDKPYFHPLRNTAGTNFTDLRPQDHPWHRGLWFAWKYLDQVNYWEENPRTGLSDGRTRIISVDRRISADKRVTIDIELHYAPTAEAPALLKEWRSVTVHPPAPDGSYAIDWHAEFKAVADELLLDRTPIPGEPGGRSWGGYAGLSLRMPQALKPGRFHSSEDLKDEEANAAAARWVAYHSEHAASVLFMEHPDNPRHPSKWYIAPQMNYFSPAILYDRSHRMQQGERLKLKYRIHLAAEELSPQAAESLWQSWVSRAFSFGG